MHPAMDQRDWERRARSKHRAGPPRTAPAPSARPLPRRHRRRRGVTPGRDVRAHPREVLAHPERGRGDRAARRDHPRDARETGGPARAGGAAGGRGPHGHRGGGHPGAGAAARKSNAEPTAATTRPTVASTDPSSSSVASLRERQRILMDCAALANRLAGVAPTDADEAFFETNDAALREMREERAAYARRGGGGVGGKDGVVQVGQRRDGVPTRREREREGRRKRRPTTTRIASSGSDPGVAKVRMTTQPATTARSIPRPSRSSPHTSAGTEPAGRSSRRLRPRLGG